MESENKKLAESDIIEESDVSDTSDDEINEQMGLYSTFKN